MTSRLDPFFNSLFDQLNREGLSYRTVCKYLLSDGVKISPQALRSWHVRRGQKIAKRTMQLEPVAELLGTSKPTERDLMLDAIHKEATSPLTAPVIDAALTSELRPLRAQIEEEERNLSALRIESQTRYPVRRKFVTNSNVPKFQTTAVGQKKKDSK